MVKQSKEPQFIIIDVLLMPVKKSSVYFHHTLVFQKIKKNLDQASMLLK